MKISIDTAKDTTEDIKKAINFLNHLVRSRENSQDFSRENVMQDASSGNDSYQEPKDNQGSNGFMNLFGSGSESQESQEKETLREAVSPEDYPSQEKANQETHTEEENKEEKNNNGVRIIEY